MQLTIHRGTKEIGGSCIELQSQSSRLFLDLGLPLVDRQGQRLDNRQYTGHTIEKLKEDQIAPDIENVYRDASNPPDGLLLSHSHLDHYGLLSHIDPSIPVYASRGTRKILEIAHFFGQTDFSPDAVRVIEPWKPLRVGGFTIMPYLADHSAIDALSFLVEADRTRLFYSGDIRSHGRKSVLFENLIKKPPDNIDYLILEGSILGRDGDGCATEQDIEAELVEHFERDGLYIASFSSQNIDRFVSVFRACKKTGRTLVVDPYTACILDSLSKLSPNLPQYDWENGFKIFFVPNSYTEKLAHSKRLYKYKSAKITFDEIKANKERLVLKDNYKLSRILKNHNLLQDAKLIYSLWEGYLEDNTFWQDNQVPVTHVHCSGHAYREDLKRLAEAIDPNIIIPNHTFYPEQFKEMFENKTMYLQDGQMVDLINDHG